MLDEELPALAVDLARRQGAEYAEGRLHGSKELGVLLKNGQVEPATIEDSYGLGVRIIYDGALAFAATNDLSRENIRIIIDESVKRAKASSPLLKQKISLSHEKLGSGQWAAEEKKNLDNLGVDELLRVLKELDDLVKDGKGGVKFPNRFSTLYTSVETKVYVNSDGAQLQSRVPRVGYFCMLTALYEGEVSTVTIPPGYAQLGESGGWEVLDRMNLYQYIPEQAENLAKAIKSKKKPPSEQVDIILGPSVTGLVAHESSGHPEEADRILGREAAQAGESYLKPGDVGMKIGSNQAYVSDDPTLPHSYGFYFYDDEGVSARKRRLIDAGIIRELLHNRATAQNFHLSSNGSARSIRFDREPIVRMANTYVEPGDYSFDELIEDIGNGVYIKSFMEWNIDDKRLNQRYVGLESFEIKNGSVGEPIRNPILEVTTPKLWSSVDARGKDLQFNAATCGKGDPMQGSPVWTGGPHIRLRSLKVGSR